MTRSRVSRLVGKLRERSDPTAPRLRVAAEAQAELSSAPIFIAGCQRSGTSLLRRIIDSHPRIACPPESRFILPMVDVLRDPVSLRGFDGMGYDRTEVARAMAAFIASFFEGYAASRDKARWADKTPRYVDCLPEIWELFEGAQARFVTIVRDGLDVAFSLSDEHRHYPAIDEQVRGAGGNVPVGAGRHWRLQNERIQAFREAHPDACFQLRYEELTTEPERTLRPMFQFLREPWEPTVVDYGQFPHHAGWEDPDVRRRRRIEPNSGKHRAWPESVQGAVREACEPMLSALGYG